MNKREKILATIIGVGLFLVGVAIFTPSSMQGNSTSDTRKENLLPLSSKEEVASSSSVAVVTQVSQEKDPCPELAKGDSPYASLEKLKAKEKVSSRFENTHLKIEGKVFRLRRFFKDGSENEKEKFLVLEEDENEEGILKESRDHKAGPLFQKLANEKSEVLYKEEGVQTQDGLFLHYVNGKLQSLQGTLQNKNLDCVMNPDQAQ